MTALSSLIPALERQGYFRHYLAFGDGNLRTWDWKLMATRLDPAAREGWKFFLCGERVSRKQLAKHCPKEALERLEELGLARRQGEGIQMDGTILIQFQGRPVFMETAQPPRSRLGDDVVAVLQQAPSGHQRNVLCLHSVGGTEALAFARTHERRVWVSGAAVGEGHIRANWEVNEGGAGLKVYGDGEALPSGQDDLILARIPTLALPEAYQDSHPDAGGWVDGADRLRATMALVASRLKADGCLAFACMVMAGDDPAVAVQRLGGWASEAGLQLEAEILSRQRLEPGVAVFNQLIFLAEKASGKGVRDLIDEFMGFYQQQGMTQIYFAKGVARLGKGRGRVRHRILEMTDRYFGTWTV